MDGNMSQIKEIVERSLLIIDLTYHGSYSPDVKGRFENGRARFEYRVLDYQLHGLCRVWYENGTLKIEERYQRGRLNGIRREYYESGKIKLQEHYVNGITHGLRIFWDENGQIKGQQMYVRGRVVDDYLHHIINSREITAKDIINIENTEVRRTFLEDMGYEKFLNQTDYKIITTDGDSELLVIDWHTEEEPIFLVKVKCPSTGAYYILRVPPNMQTVKEATAWTFGLWEERYQPIEET